MNDDSGFIFAMILMACTFFIGICAGSDYAYERMCREELLPLQETLVDSLSLVQRYEECEWWNEDE